MIAQAAMNTGDDEPEDEAVDDEDTSCYQLKKTQRQRSSCANVIDHANMRPITNSNSNHHQKQAVKINKKKL